MSHTSRPADAPGHPPAERQNHFIEDIVEADIAAGKPRVHTRFPPEPNGYLHIGHAKSICLNFGLARKYNGKFNLRFDDTNPVKEEQEYVDAIKADVRWLGGDYEGPHGGGVLFASSYFEQMYKWAEELVQKGKAYVCDLTGDEVSKQRGAPTRPGTESPYRNRSVAENLDLLRRMRKGEFPNGARTLRAKIDMASPNLNLRDPVLYRILHEDHHATGSAWSMYPMYDWAHGFEDSIEGITHSICTLEFENHRPLYDWFINAVNEGRTADGSGPWGKPIHHPRQIEFAKLRLTSVVMSKRNLLRMVQEKVVSGWDDPRMPTLSAFRRRGYTPQSIRNFCDEVGVTKVESTIDLSRLEGACRDHLNKIAPRRMAVLRPIKVVITNWESGGAADRVEMMDAVNNPEDPAAGSRQVPFSREIYVEHDDFMEAPPKGYFRLAPGAEVRLRYAYWVRCTGFKKDAAGNITEVHCTYDPQTRGGNDPPPGPDGKTRKVKGTIHWVSAAHAVTAEVRLFDRLFAAEEPGQRTGNFLDDLNPKSLEIVTGARLEPGLAAAKWNPAAESGCGVGDRFQFERLGYFCVDKESAPGKLVFNRTVTLKDTWAKAAAKPA